MIDGYGDAPQLALDNLDPDRLRFARELRGLTRKAVASLIDKTPSAVSQFEMGKIAPDVETLIRLGLALGVPSMFFMKRQRSVDLRVDNCHFRALRSATQTTRRQSVRAGQLLLELIQTLENQGVVFPEDQVLRAPASPDTLDEIESIAVEVRRSWGLGLGPVPNMVRLLESKGIVVLPLAETCAEVDAFSAWGDRPCILLGLHKSPSRARFDAAHELGHLVLHEDAVPGDKVIEAQANRFAGAFLAPKASFEQECPRRWSLAAFQALKDRWRMSLQALLHRAHDLGCISYNIYRRAFMDLSRRGLRKDEGPEWDHERPTLVEKAMVVLEGEVSLRRLAHEMSLSAKDLRELLGGHVAADVLDLIDTPVESSHAPIIRLVR